ncbi:MAG: fused MFS/spermidine synthase [Eubacteriaceae bacterium]|nr:fused MFS/spermidine synthase [Eubacteriaceae bacterium]
MAVELAASRLMAPYFSSSQIVYTIIIGTVMIAMALGNVYGGKSADKNPDPTILYRRILIAGAWIAGIPFLGRFVIMGISAVLILSVDSGFLVAAAFASCMLIFVFPLFLLGTVTPSLVRYIIENAEESGEITGRLGAYNTIGSIIGTFLPTFVTIPSVGTAATFIIFSGILIVLACLYFISIRKRPAVLMIAVILFIIFSVLGARSAFAFWEQDLSYEGESVYNYLQVREERDRMILSTNVLFGVQSVKMKSGTVTGMYYDYALAAPAMAAKDTGEPLRILILGNGSGTFATQCVNCFPLCSVDGVEIDKKITMLAREYFDLPENVTVYEYDGRAFLEASDEVYDVIMVDAYQDITIPFQMSTVEFFRLVSSHLADDGIMVLNMNMHSDGEGSINEYITNTVLTCFGSVYTADVAWTSNRELFAAKSGDPSEMLEAVLGRYEGTVLYTVLGKVSAGLERSYITDPARILTDDRAPVEVLGMKAIDEMISEELRYYQDLFKEKGLRGVLEDIL